MKLSYSKNLRNLLVLEYGMAILSILVISCPVIFKLIFFLLATYILYCYFHRYLSFKHKNSITSIKLINNSWQLQNCENKWCEATLSGEQFVTHHFAILNFKRDDTEKFWNQIACTKILIFASELENEDKDFFRKLKIYFFINKKTC
jgi:hypothetical protein